MARSRPTRHPRRLLGVLVAAGACAIAATGCSGPAINASELEAELSVQVADRLGVEPAAVAVSCPDEVPLDTGSEVTCTATTGDRSYPVTVTQVDGQGAVQWSLDDQAGPTTTATTTPG
jgi:hypothetical protein